MKAEDKLQILKFLLILVNSLFVIISISLFGCSTWILFDKSSFITVLNDEEEIKVVAGGLFVIGLVVLGVSMLGCFGVYLENRCLMALYMGFLIAIILGQLFITVLLLLKMNRIEVVLNETIDGWITEYGGNSTQTIWRLLDSVQQSVKCCGRQNYSDWQTNILIQTYSDLSTEQIYPCSCFNGSCPVFPTNEMYLFGNSSESTDIYVTGCGQKIEHWFRINILVIVGMELGLLVIQILQFALGFHIYRNIEIKIKDQHSKKLLNAAEENAAPEPDLHQSDQEYRQPDSHTYDQQHQNAYNQEYAGQSYPYDQDTQHYHDRQASGHPYDQQHNVYARVDSGQAYDQHQYQHYQHHFDPEPTSHIYDHRQDNAYDQEYAGESSDRYGDQYYQSSNDQHSPHAYSGNYNQGYVQDYDSRDNYDCY
ncbi:CD82 antigen [Colossoma macropomum]|uniref:CD82 antigen n=1 Tax=Colossoma macropomum TaxID=42526 RepID=UPI001863C4DF|nr:CD82 antigen [Colossoma macropomum]